MDRNGVLDAASAIWETSDSENQPLLAECDMPRMFKCSEGKMNSLENHILHSGDRVPRQTQQTQTMKKRYTSEQQILDKIQREKERNNAYLAQSEILEDEIKNMKADAARTGKYTMIPLVLDHKREIDRLRRICAAIIDKRLPKLKNKLSEIMTPQLPAIDNGDPSIPVK